MEQNKEKKKFKLMLAIYGTLILGVVVMVSILFVYKSPKPYDPYNILSIGIAVLIIIFATYLILKRKKEIDQGIPQYDERSKKILYLSASRAFYISLYWILALMWFSEIFTKNQIPVDAILGLAIGGMAIIWVICQIWYTKYGDKHI